MEYGHAKTSLEDVRKSFPIAFPVSLRNGVATSPLFFFFFSDVRILMILLDLDPTIEETPRGFLVHVSLDDYENPYSTKEALRRLEREHPIVPDISEHVSGHYPYH